MDTTTLLPPPPARSASAPPPPPPPRRAEAPQPSPLAPHGRPRRWLALPLLLAVGLAFADASVVALALPAIYGTFGATIVETSAVLTVYAFAVAIAGLALLALHRWIPTRLLAVAGLAVFAGASALAGFAPTLQVLLVARFAQGVGGAALLAATFPLIGAALGSSQRATSAWALAGTIGAVTGPVLGGVVTQVFDWRVVFLLQAPVAALAIVAVIALGPVGRRAAEAPEGRRPAGALVADAGFVLVFAALVGALFLAVLLLVVVWGMAPAVAAVVVSALPVGTLLARWLHPRVPAAVSAVGGALALAAGLATLALLPAESAWWAGAALGACGLGFGFLSQLLGPLAVPSGSGPRAATISSTARHLGLVLGLLVVAPVVSAGVEHATQQASSAAVAVVLDSRVGALDKIALSRDLRQAVQDAPRGESPDLSAVFAKHDAPGVAQLEQDLSDTIVAIVTRAFRGAFAVAALLAALALIPALVAVRLARRRVAVPADATAPAIAGPPRRTAAVVASAVLVGGALALPVLALPAGAAEYGAWEATDPCKASPDPYPGDGLDATTQRFVLSGLNGAACSLGVSREDVILSLDKRSGVDLGWDQAKVESAVRAGIHRSIEDAKTRGTLPGWVGSSLEWLADRAPVSWILQQLGLNP